MEAAADTQVLGIVIRAVKYTGRSAVATTLWGEKAKRVLEPIVCSHSPPLIASLLFSRLWIYYGNCGDAVWKLWLQMHYQRRHFPL